MNEENSMITFEDFSATYLAQREEQAKQEQAVFIAKFGDDEPGLRCGVVSVRTPAPERSEVFQAWLNHVTDGGWDEALRLVKERFRITDAMVDAAVTAFAENPEDVVTAALTAAVEKS